MTRPTTDFDRRVAGALVIGSSLALSSCGQILGIEDRVLPGATSSTSGSSTAYGGSTVEGGGGAGGGGAGRGGAGGDNGGGGAGGSVLSGISTVSGLPCLADLDDDPENCGACGHDCLGGACQFGRCLPIELMPEQALAEYKSIVVEPGPNGSIYYTRWRLNGRIYKTSKAPQLVPSTVTIAAADGWVSDYAIVDGTIYFPNYSDFDTHPARGVWSVPKAGGTATQLVVDGADLYYLGTVQVLVDGNDLFFSSSYGRVAIARTSTSGGPVTPLWYLGDNAPYYEACGFMKMDETFIYRGRGGEAAGILRFSRQGGAPDVLYDVFDTAAHPALQELHDGYLYWTSEDSILRRAPADGTGPIEPLLTDVWRDTLVHDGYLYAINADSRGIVRLPLDDLQSPEVVVPAGTELIGSLAADEVSLYWLMYDRGQIFRLAL